MFEFWYIRESPGKLPDNSTGWTIVGPTGLVVAAWISFTEAESITLAHNMCVINTAENLGFAEDAIAAYKKHVKTYEKA